LVEWQEGHPSCKKTWWGCGGGGAVSPVGVAPTRFVGASASKYPPLLHKNPEELFLLVPAYPGGPGPKAVKRLLLLLQTATSFGLVYQVQYQLSKGYKK